MTSPPTGATPRPQGGTERPAGEAAPEVRKAERLALQVWTVFFLLTLCFAFLKFLIGF
ncbi:MAG TPA: hypothetical protein VIL46_08295 [Gemmataceae bacterium]